jgi:hypothetical protein
MRCERRQILQASALALIAATAVCEAAGGDIISWAGNTPEWNRELGVDELRFGCSSPPAACLQNLDRVLRAEKAGQATIAMTPDGEKVAPYALEFSERSLDEPRLRAIGIDDALSAFGQWWKAGRNPGTLLSEVIANTKARNPRLQFGITLYEDQLQSPLLHDPLLSASARAAVDRVHFYVHYRQDGPQLQSYVRQVKQLFPGAAVMAGVYPYDRISYLPCSTEKKIHCTPSEEKQLFEQTLKVQLAMLDAGEVAAIEFYPGSFGAEASWKGWQSARICEPSRLQTCIDTTVEMHEITRRLLKDRHR